LLIDPFRLKNQTDSEETDLNKLENAGGEISTKNILVILEKFKGAKAIVGLWLPTNTPNREVRQEYFDSVNNLDTKLIDFCKANKVTVRSFKKDQYRISWFGFGNSSQIIGDFPKLPKIDKTDPLGLWEVEPTHPLEPLITTEY